MLRFRMIEAIGAVRNRREGRCAAASVGWGKEVTRDRFTFQIARYHELVVAGRTTVDEATWRDLGMEEVFAKVDRTITFPGRQMLYHQMKIYEGDDTILAERTRQQAVIRTDLDLREAVLRSLKELDSPDAAWLAPLLLKDLPEKPAKVWLLHVCGLAPLACFMSMALWPIMLVPGVLLAFVNLMINETHGRRILPQFAGLSQIHRLLGVADGLAALSNAHALPQLEVARQTASIRTKLRKRLGWLAMDRESAGDLVMSFITYANLFFLVDLQVYARSASLLRNHQGELVNLLEAVGSLDAALSVASFVEGMPLVCVPKRTEARYLEAVGLYHPLLAKPVGNAIHCEGRSILITGSNMAGKTTYIRTVGINLILAQTLNLCLAERAVMPRAVVCSSIRREDRLTQGDSYYTVELDRVLDMIRASEAEPLHVFLLDEIFRGTNTLERISAATAVLDYLGHHHLALVTTHDLELQELLSQGYDMWHFSEQVVDGRPGFDYRIHSGPTTGRNAIRLLELRGYPQSITSEARRIADRLAFGVSR